MPLSLERSVKLIKNLSIAQQKLACILYKQYLSGENETEAICVYGLWSIVLRLLEATTNAKSTEWKQLMENVLQITEKGEENNGLMSSKEQEKFVFELMEQIDARCVEKFQFKMVMKIMASDELRIEESYEKLLSKLRYDADIEQFSTKYFEKSLKKINTLLAKVNKGQEMDYLTPDAWNRDTSTVWTNFCDFRSTWAYMFPNSDIDEEADFFLLGEKESTHKVSLLTRSGTAENYGLHKWSKATFKSLGLICQESRYGFLFLLPQQNTVDAMEHLEKAVFDTDTNDNIILKILQEQSQTVLDDTQIPQFEVQSAREYSLFFRDLECANILEDGADMKSFSTDCNVSKIYLRSRLKIDDSGLLTSPSTVAGAKKPKKSKSKKKSQSTSFIANSPFIVIVYNVVLKNMMYIGKISEPMKSL